MLSSYKINTAEDFALVMRSVRVEKNITQSQLAQKVGKTRHWVSDVERGITTPTLSAVLSVMRVMGFAMTFSAAANDSNVDLISLALGEEQ